MSVLSHREKMMLSVLYNTHGKLEPTIDVVFGARYPLAEDILGVKPFAAKNILKKLSNERYLIHELYSVILKCPVCSGYWLLLRLHCPYCNSPKLKREEGIKHYNCGYVGFKSEFIRGDGYVCPKCGDKLEKLGTEYKLIGTWYMCYDCGEKFGEPREMLLCNNCQKEFERDELVLEGLLRYMANEASIKDALLEFNLNKIVEVFKGKWDVLIPAKVEGASGITHIFSGSLDSKGILSKKVLFDIDYDTEAVGPDSVMKFFAKMVDVKSDFFILLGIPKFSLDAKGLAKAYKINILEGDRVENLMKDLKKIVQSVIEERENDKRGGSGKNI